MNSSPGTFILSLDCEGRWGVADKPTAASPALSDSNLRKAYSDVFNVLSEYDIAASVAVVGLFSLSDKSLGDLDHEAIATRLPYTKYAMSRLAAKDYDGWGAEWIENFFDGRHERACHGVTHTPFSSMSKEDLDFEFSLISIGKDRTLVFPRNDIAHLEYLSNYGFIGARAARSDTPVSRLISEAWPFISSDDHSHGPKNGIVLIPSGRFINWVSGVRAAIPRGLTAFRSNQIMIDAVRTSRVAHFWSHPENIATSAATLENFRSICKSAARLRDKGHIVIKTQRDYVIECIK